MSETLKSRLIELLKAKRMTQTEFARRLGASPTYLGAMRKAMPVEKLKKVYEMFPDLNKDWLLYGEGEMFISQDTGKDFKKDYMVPLLPVDAYAGSLQMWSEGVLLDDCEQVISPVADVDFAIRVMGNSMEPEFQSGTMLFIKRINEKSFIPWGNPMVIDTENGVLVKLVYPSDYKKSSGVEEEEYKYIEARSYNPAYPPIQIPTDSIYGMYRVVTGVRNYTTF